MNECDYNAINFIYKNPVFQQLLQAEKIILLSDSVTNGLSLSPSFGTLKNTLKNIYLSK